MPMQGTPGLFQELGKRYYDSLPKQEQKSIRNRTILLYGVFALLLLSVPVFPKFWERVDSLFR